MAAVSQTRTPAATGPNSDPIPVHLLDHGEYGDQQPQERATFEEPELPPLAQQSNPEEVDAEEFSFVVPPDGPGTTISVEAPDGSLLRVALAPHMKTGDVVRMVKTTNQTWAVKMAAKSEEKLMDAQVPEKGSSADMEQQLLARQMHVVFSQVQKQLEVFSTRWEEQLRALEMQVMSSNGRSAADEAMLERIVERIMNNSVAARVSDFEAANAARAQEHAGLIVRISQLEKQVDQVTTEVLKHIDNVKSAARRDEPDDVTISARSTPEIRSAADRVRLSVLPAKVEALEEGLRGLGDVEAKGGVQMVRLEQEQRALGDRLHALELRCLSLPAQPTTASQPAATVIQTGGRKHVVSPRATTPVRVLQSAPLTTYGQTVTSQKATSASQLTPAPTSWLTQAQCSYIPQVIEAQSYVPSLSPGSPGTPRASSPVRITTHAQRAQSPRVPKRAASPRRAVATEKVVASTTQPLLVNGAVSPRVPVAADRIYAAAARVWSGSVT